MASIHVIQGPDKGRAFQLADDECVVGRVSTTVELTDRTVSRNHARLTAENGRWILRDLGSANGTYLNGERLMRPTPLKRGDQVRCGTTLLVFGGGGTGVQSGVDLDENGGLVDAAIVATVPSSEDSVIIPTPEAGAEAIGNLRILYDLIAETGSIFNIDVLLRRTLDKVFEVLTADRGFIMLTGEDGQLTVKVSRLEGESSQENIPISRTIINEVFSKQVGVLSSNAMTDKRFASGKSVQDFGIRSAVCVPIKGRERILGVIHVDCSVADHTYSTEQLRLLTAIGYQTGLAIENVRLYESAVQSERLAAVGETVAFLSHHIKNMLQALGGAIDVVELGIRQNDLAKAHQSWPIVHRTIGRINTLILNMLTFSKRRSPLLENVNINHVLAECVDLVAAQADEQGAALLTDLDDLPAMAADADGLQQVFLNLLNNALDAVGQKSGAVTVSSRYDSMNRNVIVRVADNGSGIEPDQMDQIFTPFHSSKGNRGTGLGLAVAKKVIEEHRGKIEVASAIGRGTTFTITLPSVPGQDAGETVGPAR